jgi:hypothetical protein
MAQTSSNKGKKRVTVKVTDMETGEELSTSEHIIINGFCSFCSCSSCTILTNPRGPVETTQ